MNRLMMMCAGQFRRLMDEAPAPGGEGGGGGETAALGGVLSPADREDGAETVEGQGQSAGGTAALGGETAAPGEGTAALGGEGKPDGGEGTKPAPVNIDDFVKGITLGDADEFKGVEIDAEAVKAVAPVMAELGLDGAKASRLVQSFARHQLAVAKAAGEKEAADNLKYLQDGYRNAVEKCGAATIKAADSFVRPYMQRSPLLAAMLRNGLGNDTVFIEMCARAAAATGQDSGSGAAAGTSGPSESSDVQAWKAALAAANV